MALAKIRDHEFELQQLLQGANTAQKIQIISAHAVVFREELSDMVQETVRAVREMKVLIHPEFADMIQQLKTIQYDRKGNPDKSTYTMDLFDAFMMAVSHSGARGFYVCDPSDLGQRPCQVCGRMVELASATEWTRARCCPEHRTLRAGRVLS